MEAAGIAVFPGMKAADINIVAPLGGVAEEFFDNNILPPLGIIRFPALDEVCLPKYEQPPEDS